MSDGPILAVERLRVAYPGRGGSIEAVRDVSLSVGAGECVGIVGESGSGKTQLCLALMGLLPPGARIGGAVRFAGAPDGAPRAVRGERIAMVFQDPQTALTPHLRIGSQMAEVLVHHRRVPGSQAREAARSMLARVGIPDPAGCLRRYPHELSGGMRQRVLIAMCLLCAPQLLIADEPTTALDVTVQAQVLELLARLRREQRMAILLVSHDLAVVAGLAARIVVMYAGRVVEEAPADALFRSPRHPYTAALIACAPNADGPIPARMATLPGQPPGAAERFAGCPFVARCDRSSDRCRHEPPAMVALDDGRRFACHEPLPA